MAFWSASLCAALSRTLVAPRRSALAPVRSAPVRSAACSARRRQQQVQSGPEYPNQSRRARLIDAGTRRQRRRAPLRREERPLAAMSLAARAPADSRSAVSLVTEPARPKIPQAHAPSSSRAILPVGAFWRAFSYARRSLRRLPATLRWSTARVGPLEAGGSALPRRLDAAMHVPVDFLKSSAIAGPAVTKLVVGLSIR